MSWVHSLSKRDVETPSKYQDLCFDTAKTNPENDVWEKKDGFNSFDVICEVQLGIQF